MGRSAGRRGVDRDHRLEHRDFSIGHTEAAKGAAAPNSSIAGTRTVHTLPFAATPTTVDATPPVPYYAADAPAGLTVQSATIQQPQDNYYGPSTYQLWAQPGASSDTGSWFSVESYPGSGPGTFAIGAYRKQVDHLSIAISRPTARQALVQFSPAGKASVTMTASGLSDDDIIRIAQQIRVVRNLVQFSDTAAVDGYEMISTMQPWNVVHGIPVEQLFYSDGGDDPAGGFGITVSLRHAGNPTGSDINRETALRFLLGPDRTFFDVDGNNAVAGNVVGQTNYSLATWTAGDHIVTVSGSMPVPQLVAIAQGVHQIPSGEWSSVMFQAAQRSGFDNFGDYTSRRRCPSRRAPTPTPCHGRSRSSTARFEDHQQIVWQWDTAGFGTPSNGQAKITSVVDDKRTYVLAELPRAVAGTAQLQIAPDGLDPVLVPFTDPDVQLDRTLAAYVFSEPVAFTAQIIGADGAVLADWPPA